MGFLKKGRRAAAFILCAVLFFMTLEPCKVMAFSVTPGEVVSCEYITSSESPMLSADGGLYYSPANWVYITYNADGSVVINSTTGGEAKGYMNIIDASGERHSAYCLEAGVRFHSSSDPAYTASKPEADSYFNSIPAGSRYWIKMALLYGWQPGRPSPVPGANENDFYFATQVIIWEFQQQIRTSPRNVGDANGISWNMYYQTIQGRPAEACYNWLLEKMYWHNVIPSFASSTREGVTPVSLTYDQASGLYTATVTDTNGTLVDIVDGDGNSGVSITRNGDQYTFTSDHEIPDPVTFWSWKHDVPESRDDMLVYQRSTYQAVVTGAEDPVWYYVGVKTEPMGKAALRKSSSDPGITSGNRCYSLEGAVYGVYRDEACTQLAGTLTTDAAGNTQAVDLAAGNYWIKETTAPRGYALDETRYPVTVKSGETAVVDAVDAPLNDPVSITLEKIDKDTGETAQAKASLSGAQFTVKYYDGYYDKNSLPAQPTRTWVIETKELRNPSTGEVKYYTNLNNNYKVSGDDFYYRNNNPDPTLPLGTVTIEETKAPEGYLLDGAYLKAAGSEEKITGLYVAQILPEGNLARLSGGNAYSMSDTVIHGGVKIQKRDYETLENNPQGNATLSGAEFAVINQNNGPVYVAGQTYAKGETVLKLTTDANGLAQTAADVLPYGHYKVKETKAPGGYLGSGKLEQEFDITRDGMVADLTAKGNSIENQVIRGGVKVKKRDLETLESSPQGNASLAGAQFTITNMSQSPVIVDGKSYAKGKVVLTLTTDKDGFAQTPADKLPYGHYKITETKAPQGYLNTGTIEQEFDITENGKIVDVTTKEKCILNQVIRGGIKIQKRDLETQEASPQGGASLSGAEFVITNMSKNPVIVGGKSYAKGEAVMAILTDESGLAATPADALPYGHYKITETKAPEGYLNTGVIEREFGITQNGSTVDLSDSGDSIQNQVKRGDFSLRKVDGESQDTMAGVEFKVTSNTTGESHTFTTDENGYYSSENNWNRHSSNTNKGSPEDGLWFGTTINGKTAPVDDTLGALPYDTYTIEELKGKNNADKEMFKGKLTIRRDHVTVSLNNIENFSGMEPRMETKATDTDTKTSLSAAKKGMEIVDTIEYWELVPGEAYTLKGTLMDKETGKPLLADGKEVTAEKTFTPEEAHGEETVTFTLDGRGLEGKTMVAFEKCFYKEKEIAAHEDLKEEGQTIYIPKINTNASDVKTGSSHAKAEKEVTITDEVEYQNLVPGKEYTLKGTLMDKETRKPLLVNGKEVTAEKKFTPKESSGKEQLTFLFDGAALSGKTIVAFEKCLYEGKEVAVHEDIEAEDQTIYIPQINTNASDVKTGSSHAKAEKEVTVTDEVEYQNLVPGKEYTLKGTLMDKETGKPLQTGGKEVTAEKTFKPEESNGKEQLEFSFDGTGLGGKSIVAFEKCFYEGKEVAVHEDIGDENQTILIEEPPEEEEPPEGQKPPESEEPPGIFTPPQTGIRNRSLWFAGAGVLLTATAAFLVWRICKNRKNKGLRL